MNVSGVNPQPSCVAELIAARIKAAGPVSFAWFMNQALYHPHLGYYSSGRANLGRRGDYFTNVSVGPMFGRLLAAQLHEIWEVLGRPEPFNVVEQGAHNGDLARDVLGAIKQCFNACYETVQYVIVEPFPVLRAKQEHALADLAGKVSWHDSLEKLQPFTGVHLSNELLDAMPVHPLRCKNSEGSARWIERCVDQQNGEFSFVDCPITDSRVAKEAEKLPSLPAGFETEIRPAALEWVDALALKLRRGYVLTIDYGYVREDLRHRQNTAGTCQTRAGHRVLPSPFENIGGADITAHVDWTAIAERAREQGFKIAGFTDQHHCLTGIIATHPELAATNDAASRRQLQTLLHPGMLGRSFQVLGLTRGIDSDVVLAAFKFGRNAGEALGV
jgi:SAM-dependent MidA family methyltransferase